jgi:uncharacterized membrane protein YfcA
MTLWWIAEGMAVGGATGFLAGLLGVGGGFILVPLLTLLGMPIHMAVATSMVFIICAGLAGIMQHVRQGSIDIIVAGIITLPATMMAYIGTHLSQTISPRVLHLLFGVLLGVIPVFFHFLPLQQLAKLPTDKPVKPPLPYVLHRQRIVADVPYTYHVNIFLAILSGLGAGTITGFFGVGGGFILVPTLVLVLQIPMTVSIGTSLAVILLPALIGTLIHVQSGYMEVGLWLPLAASGMVASQLGARCMLWFPAKILRRLFQGLVFSAALFMLGKGMLE